MRPRIKEQIHIKRVNKRMNLKYLGFADERWKIEDGKWKMEDETWKAKAGNAKNINIHQTTVPFFCKIQKTIRCLAHTHIPHTAITALSTTKHQAKPWHNPHLQAKCQNTQTNETNVN